jgi:two-component system, NtrC family, nitrogen regulation response regulator NtrX
MDNPKSRILVADDDPNLCEIISSILRFEGYSTDHAFSGEETLKKIESDSPDLVLLDFRLPDISGLDVLTAMQKRKLTIPVIMISGQGSIRTALMATEMGVYDFLEKPLDPDRVLLMIKNALERRRLEKEKASLLQAVKDHYVMIGRSPGMQKIHELIVKAAKTNSKVLIEGENGTGKELVARAIHHNSAIADRPFVAVNCAAIPETLIESELFGHKKGSFTGAFADKPGKFQSADGGTLFLDEIGDMSLMTQAKVLRMLEDGVVEMIGSNRPLPVDVRLVAATNKDLQEFMRTGRFREDLFFRINVLSIKLPPLRERREDIPLIVEHYLPYFCNEHGIKMKRLTSDAMERLSRHSWPGNVRELKNFIEKMVVLAEPEEVRIEDMLPFFQNTDHPLDASRFRNLKLHDAKERFEREFVRERLEESSWNITRAAEKLGIPRTYLHKKVKQMGLGREGGSQISDRRSAIDD